MTGGHPSSFALCGAKLTYLHIPKRTSQIKPLDVFSYSYEFLHLKSVSYSIALGSGVAALKLWDMPCDNQFFVALLQSVGSFLFFTFKHGFLSDWRTSASFSILWSKCLHSPTEPSQSNPFIVENFSILKLSHTPVISSHLLVSGEGYLGLQFFVLLFCRYSLMIILKL